MKAVVLVFIKIPLLFFTLAMVIFREFVEAEKTSKKITELRHSLKIKNEFKFSKSHPTVKNAFFDAISDYDFLVRALFVEKSLITSNHLRQCSENFYNYFFKVLLDYDSGILKHANIKIDGRGSRDSARNLKAYIRKQIGDVKIKNLKFIDSQQDNLIQLADMVVGAIAKAYTNNLS